MEITICDPYSFCEKLILDHEITCKELKEKITTQFGRDTTNCTIYFNQEPLKDNKNIQLSSLVPFIIVDGDIEKMKHRTDNNNFLYASSRFQKKQQYKAIETRIPHFALVLNRQMSDSSDEDGEDEDPLFYFANENNSSDTNNENTDEQDEIDDIDAQNDSDSYTEMSNITSSDNEENDTDNENIGPFGQNQQFLYFIPPNNQDRDNQIGIRRPLGGDFTILNPYPPINFLIQNPQRRYQQPQMRPRFMDFFGGPDSDGPMLEETLGNDNDDDDDENENGNGNGNENDNNNQLQIDLTAEENETVNRICRENERFDRFTIVQVFEACGRDAETTIQCLSTM